MNFLTNIFSIIPEYTFLAILSVILVIILDLILATKLFKTPRFWLFQLICFGLQFFTDGYLTWRPIYIVNPAKILNFYIFTIPLENFIFGFSMIYLVTILFEFFVREKESRSI